MAEKNELEGFEDLDKMFQEGEASGGAADQFSKDLDNLLGETGAEAAAPAAPGAAGAAATAGAPGGDSELDSFFEDLSTIDDLEVQEEKAAPKAPAAPEPQAAPPPPKAEAKPRRVEKPKPKPRGERAGGGMLRKLVAALLLIGLFGAGYAAYVFLFPKIELPWEVFEPAPKKAPPAVIEVPPPPPPPPPVVVQPPPPPPVAKPAPKPVGPGYGIQVATCFFDSCTAEFGQLLKRNALSVTTQQRRASNEGLELYTRTLFENRERVRLLAERINLENRLEGHAYVMEDAGGYRISMGTFGDLTRANVVKDSLNQMLSGSAVFATRVRKFPYTLTAIVGGRFPSRTAAERGLQRLRKVDERFAGAFIVAH
ncbi:MAG: hypothetical protein HY423_05265 [Candidatus Lambdaproteobacteria bacterium]|nr:hypothetical protein [Candidatus Lambdaproteobacteria bacterium]